MDKDPTKPYVVELNGSINGTPRNITMDVREVIDNRAEREGRALTDDELETESQQLYQDIVRTKEAVTRPRPATSLKGILKGTVSL